MTWATTQNEENKSDWEFIAVNLASTILRVAYAKVPHKEITIRPLGIPWTYTPLENFQLTH